jgi:sRNA-binding carbon storage regulator CsrA
MSPITLSHAKPKVHSVHDDTKHKEFATSLLNARPMLVLSRRTDESIEIQPAEDADRSMTVAQLFADGPILITLLGISRHRFKLGIEAPEQLAIRRTDRRVEWQEKGSG